MLRTDSRVTQLESEPTKSLIPASIKTDVTPKNGHVNTNATNCPHYNRHLKTASNLPQIGS